MVRWWKRSRYIRIVGARNVLMVGEHRFLIDEVEVVAWGPHRGRYGVFVNRKPVLRADSSEVAERVATTIQGMVTNPTIKTASVDTHY